VGASDPHVVRRDPGLPGAGRPHGGEVEEFGPTEQVGASISTEDPAWDALVLDREAQADQRLFFLNRADA
jgi:hypothetical protein